jgi:hypothetical protein
MRQLVEDLASDEKQEGRRSSVDGGWQRCDPV